MISTESDTSLQQQNYHCHSAQTSNCAPSVNENGNAISGSRAPGAAPDSAREFSIGQAKAKKQLITVSVLCGIFMVGELVGGILSGSLALMSDASHLATDLISFMISLLAIHLSQKTGSKRLSFGYHRAEILGALVSVVLIWVLTGILCFLAVQRVIDQSFTIIADEMIIVAGLGVAFNIIMGAVLHSEMCSTLNQHHHHGHSHGGGGHGHSHGSTEVGFENPSSNTPDTDDDMIIPSDSSVNISDTLAIVSSAEHNVQLQEISVDSPSTRRRGKKQKDARNINVRAAFIHVIGDLIQSIGVLIAAYVIKFKPEWKLADPICTFMFSVLVICTTILVMRDILLVLMEAAPRGFDPETIRSVLKEIPGVVQVHDIHIWSLTMDRWVVIAHVAIANEDDNDGAAIDSFEILQAGTKALKAFDRRVHKTVLQVEPYHEQTIKDCTTCQKLPD